MFELYQVVTVSVSVFCLLCGLRAIILVLVRECGNCIELTLRFAVCIVGASTLLQVVM